jgi:hypothetical protein
MAGLVGSPSYHRERFAGSTGRVGGGLRVRRKKRRKASGRRGVELVEIIKWRKRRCIKWKLKE